MLASLIKESLRYFPGMKRHLVATVAACLASASMGAWALGFDRVRAIAVLGQPFEATVPLRVEPEDGLLAHCVSAEVYYAETRQLADVVTAQLEMGSGPQALVRVRSATPIDEPMVTVYLTIGCNVRMTRKWIAFADPPSSQIETRQQNAAPAAAPMSVPVESVLPAASFPNSTSGS